MSSVQHFNQIIIYLHQEEALEMGFSLLICAPFPIPHECDRNSTETSQVQGVYKVTVHSFKHQKTLSHELSLWNVESACSSINMIMLLLEDLWHVTHVLASIWSYWCLKICNMSLVLASIWSRWLHITESQFMQHSVIWYTGEWTATF